MYTFGSSNSLTLNQVEVRPEEFGAVGDGTTDDLIPINKAIEAAKVLNGICVFGPKTYSFSAALVLWKNSNLRGVAGATYLKRDSDFVMFDTTTNLSDGITLTDLTIYGLSSVSAAFDGANRIGVTLDGVTFTAFTGNPFNITSWSYCTLRDVLVSGGGALAAGMAFTTCDHFTFDNVMIENCTGYGAYIGSGCTRMSGTISASNMQQGIIVDTSTYVTISGSTQNCSISGVTDTGDCSGSTYTYTSTNDVAAYIVGATGTPTPTYINAGVAGKYTVQIDDIDLLSGTTPEYSGTPLPSGFKYFLDKAILANTDADAPVATPPAISIGSDSGYPSISNYSATEITDVDTREVITLIDPEIVLEGGDIPKIRVDTAATGPSVLTGELVLEFTKIPV